MPKKKETESPEAQGERFRAEVERLVAAGELNPTDADDALDRITQNLKVRSGETAKL